jgi:hypothetical protein
MKNLRLIQHGFASLPATIKERFFRADSASYDQEVLAGSPTRTDRMVQQASSASASAPT